MATGDKKRAVMTDDINNSGSSYPVMPLKEIDQTPTAGNTDHLVSSAGVADAVANSFFSMAKGTLATGSDLNDIATGTLYQLVTNRSYGNTPGGINLWGILICITPFQNSTNKYQVIFSTGGHVYFRCFDGSSWLAWRESTFTLMT